MFAAHSWAAQAVMHRPPAQSCSHSGSEMRVPHFNNRQKNVAYGVLLILILCPNVIPEVDGLRVSVRCCTGAGWEGEGPCYEYLGVTGNFHLASVASDHTLPHVSPIRDQPMLHDPSCH